MLYCSPFARITVVLAFASVLLTGCLRSEFEKNTAKAAKAAELADQLSFLPANTSSSPNPKITGNVSEGTRVDIYSGAGCSGAIIATGDSVSLRSGISLPSVTVPSSNVYSMKTTASGATPGCSPAITYNAIQPTVTNVSSSNTNGSYHSGQTLTITVQFSSVVTVTGTPQLVLETGLTDRTINYVFGSGTNTLTFFYIVQPTDDSLDLDYVSSASLLVNGSTIKDSYNNNASYTLPAPGSAGSLGANKAIVIDNTAAVLGFVVGAGSPTPPNPALYGTTLIDTDLTFTLKNTGTAVSNPITTSIPASADSAKFSIQADNCNGNTLAINATCTIVVRFLASTQLAGTYSAASIRATAASGGTATNGLSGSVTSNPILGFVVGAADPTPPNPALYGTVSANTDVTFTLTNTGNDTTSLISTSIPASADSAKYTISSDSCSGTSLTPAATCNLTVRFLAGTQLAGTYSAANLQASAASGGTVTNGLSGIVACPVASVTPYSVSGATSYLVPGGCVSIIAKVWGAGGGGGAYGGSNGGAGAFTTGTVAVTPGESLTVDVGGGGFYQGGLNGVGGHNGGGNAGESAGGGGGYSTLKRGATPLLLSGAGGGGAGAFLGGDAGTTTGSAGTSMTSGDEGQGSNAGTGGGGGAAGTGGTAGIAGSTFQGGAGGNAPGAFGGGGGGGGLRGGGGGGGSTNWTESGGGGGGRSFVHASVTASSMTAAAAGVPGGSGDADYISPNGYGGLLGGDGLIVIRTP